jgi:hypothetical protein
VKDELVVVGEVISDSEMLRIALKGFTKEWEVFVKCVVGRQKLLDCSRLWDDFTQEEIRERSQGKAKTNIDIDENAALAVKIKGKKKKDLNKIRCYVCNKLGHFASHCPNRKKEKDKSCAVASIVVDDFSKEFEKEFCLVSLDSSMGSSERFADSWIIDSGASKHMTGMWGAL